MKPESYPLERWRGSLRQFLNQAYRYQPYFNLLRRNGNRGGATPEELRAARAPTADPKIFFLPPVLLSWLDAHHLRLPRQVVMGQNVPGYVTPLSDFLRDPTAGSSVTELNDLTRGDREGPEGTS